MEKYNVIICLTFHEGNALDDTIKNFLHYMPNSYIIVNNNSGADLDYLNRDCVHILKNSFKIDYWGTMIPIHINMADYIKEHKITSDYVLMLSSNQLFIRKGFYDFMKNYKGGYFCREIPGMASPSKLIDGKDIRYQSNHDGMFFLYQDFLDMINFFEEEYRNKRKIGHDEEFLYITYLLKKYKENQFAEFSTYNCWTWQPRMDLELLEDCKKKNMYIVKRVIRDMGDDVRTHIREMDRY